MKNNQKISLIYTLLPLLTFLMGLLDILSAISPGVPARLAILRPIFPFIIHSTVRLGTSLIGLSLIFLSQGLRKRKKVAWVVSIVVLAISFVFHLIKGLDVEEAIVTTALLVALVYERKNFTASPDVPSVIQGIKALVLAFVFTIFYGTFGLYLFERGERGVFTIFHSFQIVFNTFFFVTPPPVFSSYVVNMFFGSIYVIGFLSISFAVFMIFRPVIFRFDASDEDRKRARRLFEKFGRNYAAETMLLPGKYYYFNGNERGFVTYKPVGGYAIVLTEPICAPQDKVRNTKEFINFCEARGWTPIFNGVSEEYARKSIKLGLKNISIGRMAVINLEDYDFEGLKKKPLRYSISISERLGYTFRVSTPPISDDEFLGYKSTSSYWLTHEKGKEMHFFVGYLDKQYIKNNMVAGVYDAKGKNVAFTNFYEYGDREIAIDLMRHKNVPPDTMLYLFTKLIIWAKERGYKKLNLGMAVFYGMGGKGTTAEEKAIKIITSRFGNIYNFKGLYVFKSKFQPDWVPYYFVYPSRLDLTGALVALIRID